jgi:hypothetical protein
MNTPFSHEHAAEICEDFEDLIDTEYKMGTNTYDIDAVVISPFSETDKIMFIERFLSYKNHEQAIKVFNVERFDVLVIAHDIETGAHTAIDIRTYAKENGIVYSFDEMKDH